MILHAAATTVTLRTHDRWPVSLHVAPGGILAASAAGEMRIVGETLTSGRGLHALLALDRADLRRSDAIVLAPSKHGERILAGRRGPSTVLIGDFGGGSWRTYETIAISWGPVAFRLDADHATCFVLFSRPGKEGHWTHFGTSPDVSRPVPGPVSD